MKRKRSPGFTLLEVVVAVIVSVAVFLGVGVLFQKSSEGLEFFSTVGSNETITIRSVQQLVDEIRLANDSEIAIDSSGDDYDSLTITKEVDGIDYRIEFAVDDSGNLMKTVTNTTEKPDQIIETRLLAANVDSFDGDNKGFSVSQVTLYHTDGSVVKNSLGNPYYVYDIAIRLSMTVKGDEEITKNFSTRVATRA